MGHKGPVFRPKCIRPGRARTQILFNSIRPPKRAQLSSTGVPISP